MNELLISSQEKSNLTNCPELFFRKLSHLLFLYINNIFGSRNTGDPFSSTMMRMIVVHVITNDLFDSSINSQWLSRTVLVSSTPISSCTTTPAHA